MRFSKLRLALVLLTVTALGAKAVEINDQLRISGFGMFHYSDTDRSNDVGRAELHPVYISTDVTPNEDMRFLFEIEYEHVPKATSKETKGEIKVSRAFIEHAHSDAVNVQAGQFFSPVGLWVPIHWRLLTPSYDRPIFFENKAYTIPGSQLGVHYFGQKQLGDSPVLATYNTWLSLGADSFGANKATTEFDNLGVNLQLTVADMISFGGAYQNLNSTPGFPRDQDSLLLFARLSLLDDKLILSTEHITTDIEARPENEEEYQDLSAWYLGVEYHLTPGWRVYYRYDRGDDVKRSGAEAPLKGIDLDTTINTLLLSWSPFAGTELSAELTSYQFDASDAEDYTQWRVSVGQLF